MRLPKNAEALRIYIAEGDRYKGRLLAEAVVDAAREAGLAGATVTRSILSYGTGSVVHSNKILRLAEDLSVVIEIVDEPDKLDAFQPVLDEMLDSGLVTRAPVTVALHRHSGED
jgi:hypothetical protein